MVKPISMRRHMLRIRVFLLPLICAIALVGCATTEHVPANAREFRSGAQSFDLSERQRLLCEQKASEGDIVAAKTLVEYYEMVQVDEKQYQHWLGVVARLQKARAKHLREKANP